MDNGQRFRRKAEKFETLEQQQYRKKVKYRAFYIFLGVSFTAAFFIVCFTVFFRINNIKTEGNSRYSDAVLADALGINAGESLYSFSADAIANNIVRTLPYIKEISITRVLPSNVVVKVTEENPTFYYQSNGQTYLLSDSLVVVEREPEEDCSALVKLNAAGIKRCITGEQATFVDSKLSGILIEIYKCLGRYELLPYLNSITAETRFDIQFRIKDRFDVYLGSSENLDVKIRFLVGILGYLYEDDTGKINISNAKEATYSPYK